MKDGESVKDYCARTMGIANKMRFHGEQMNDVAIVEKILRSLAPKYDYVVCSIEESKDIDDLSLDELQSSLLEEVEVEVEVEVEEGVLEAIEMEADSIKASRVMMINQIFQAKAEDTKKGGRNRNLQRRRK
ncbi:hypothetical protein ACOSQ2_005151 [Xanthoceras sorbifolium]